MPTRNVNFTEALDSHASYLAFLRNEAATGFAELDRGEGIEKTSDELMDGIEEELGISA